MEGRRPSPDPLEPLRGTGQVRHPRTAINATQLQTWHQDLVIIRMAYLFSGGYIGWSAFRHQEMGEEGSNGIGTIQVGGKVVFPEEKYHHAAPGVAVQYEAELPTA